MRQWKSTRTHKHTQTQTHRHTHTDTQTLANRVKIVLLTIVKVFPRKFQENFDWQIQLVTIMSLNKSVYQERSKYDGPQSPMAEIGSALLSQLLKKIWNQWLTPSPSPLVAETTFKGLFWELFFSYPKVRCLFWTFPKNILERV